MGNQVINTLDFALALLVFAVDCFQGFLTTLHRRLRKFPAATQFTNHARIDRFALVTLQCFVDAFAATNVNN